MKVFSVLILVLFYNNANSAVLIEEGGKPTKSSISSTSIIGSGYGSSYGLRSNRRVGIGTQFAGQSGLAGLAVELNFTPKNSVVTSFGGGPGFQSFSMQWKYVFGGRYFAPYTTLGYARWYNSQGQKGGLQKTNPSFLPNRFLNEEQKQTGKFAKDLFTPSVGLQYYQTSGEFVGTSMYVEIVPIIDIQSFESIPTGGLGFYYYF